MTDLKPCKKCKSNEKINATLAFGHLTMSCRNCDFYIVSDTRSDDVNYILDKEMRERWNE